jgi:hypothetical protein
MASNRVTWLPSTDPDIATYTVYRGTTSVGPTWVQLAIITHSLTDSAVYSTTEGLFFYVDDVGTSTSWYKIVAEDGTSQLSSPSIFQVGGVYPTGRTDVSIANLALGLCGVKRYITSLSATNTVEAVTCGLNYPIVRDELLSEIDWPFARKRASLTYLVDSLGEVVTRTGWGYMYDLPQDCLLDRYIHVGINQPIAHQRVPYSIEPSETGQSMVLLTDHDAPELVYTSQVTDPNSFPSYFVNALAARLAMAMIVPLAIDKAAAQHVYALANQMTNRAVAMAFRQGETGPAPDSEFTQVRGGGVTNNWSPV